MRFVYTVDRVTMMIRTYSELSKLKTFKERYEYLRLGGVIGADTFGFDRYLNQIFYRSMEWKSVRDFVILMHHMNPISVDDILKRRDFLLNPEFLISTILTTHNAIHYGDESLLVAEPIVRSRNDTCPWKL